MNDGTCAAEIATSWQSLAATALLGTERQSSLTMSAGGPIGDMIRQFEGTSIERHLLLAAAALSVYQRAGALPPRLVEPLPRPCQLKDLPRCTPRAARSLVAILEGQYADVLPEWLSRARSAGLRASEETLPALLEAGHSDNKVADAIAAVAGERGRWLASQNPDWGYAAVDVSADPGQNQGLWETGSRTARRTLLRRLRQVDPQAARQLLESTLTEEGAEVRAEFIALLRAGLSSQDEPFLEKALDDRSKEVRRAAAELLATMPDSRFVQRMVVRARNLLQFQRGRLAQKARVLVTLPEKCDAAMVRDAVDARPRWPEKIGQRAGWLLQIVSAVPPSLWSGEWNCSPSDILQAAGHDDEWRDVLVQCWAQATGNHRDREWASGILHTGWAVSILHSEDEKGRLLEVLPAAEADAFLVGLLASEPSFRAMELVLSYRRSWSPELTRAAIRMLHHYTSDLGLPWQSNGRARQMAVLMDAGLAGEASQVLRNSADRGSSWERSVESLLQVLEFRQNMNEELTP